MDDTNINSDDQVPIVNQPEKTTYNGLLDPRGPYLKWFAVFFMCFLSFGKIISILFLIFIHNYAYFSS